jgi:hypothetical protein
MTNTLHICENEQCGAEFFPVYRGQEFCGGRCRREAKRPKTKKKMDKAIFAKDAVVWCETPGCKHKKDHDHHVVPKAIVEQFNGSIDDPRNQYSQCFKCHFNHHYSASKKIRVKDLKMGNLEFAFETLGDYAWDWFQRVYDDSGHDDRLDILKANDAPCT